MRIKVVWICFFSNAEIRKHLYFKRNPIEPILMKMIHRNYAPDTDIAIWNTNAIQAIKDCDEIDLHVICPYRDIVGKSQSFIIDGVNYHFIRDENSSIYRKIFRFLFTKTERW